MATYGQLAMAAQEAQDRASFESAHNREQARRTRAGKWGGWGRTIGLLGAGLATAATGGLAAPVAAGLVGLGGLAGRSVGRALGGGRERDADKNVDALFYQGEQRKFGKEIGDYQAGMRERMMVDTGKDALSAFMMAKYFKPGMEKMKGKFLGRFGSPDQKLAMMTGDPNAADTIARARGASQYLAGPEAGMFGEEDIVRRLNPSVGPQGPMPVGQGLTPTQQFGTNPLGADLSTSVPTPYSPTAPAPDTYGAAINRGSAMSDAGYLNDTIRQSLRLPTSVPDQMGGMNYQQWMGQSDNAFESYLNQGQQGSLFDMISPHMQQPRRMVY
jgi:hypothetical protein